MNRRILYIVIVVFVLVVGIFVLRPMLTGKGGSVKPTATTANAAKAGKPTAPVAGKVATKPVPAPASPAKTEAAAPAAEPAKPLATTSAVGTAAAGNAKNEPESAVTPAKTEETKPIAEVQPTRPPVKDEKAASSKKAVGAKAAPKSTARGARRVADENTPEPAAMPPTAAPVAVKDTTPPLTWGGDPFVRDWLMAGELRDMKLRAVTIGRRSLALINDRVVALGDTISGKRVALITRDSVVFEFGGQRRGLKIGE